MLPCVFIEDDDELSSNIRSLLPDFGSRRSNLWQRLKSSAGKGKVSLNAYKGGTWKMLRELAKALIHQQNDLIHVLRRSVELTTQLRRSPINVP